MAPVSRSWPLTPRPLYRSLPGNRCFFPLNRTISKQTKQSVNLWNSWNWAHVFELTYLNRLNVFFWNKSYTQEPHPILTYTIISLIFFVNNNIEILLLSNLGTKIMRHSLISVMWCYLKRFFSEIIRAFYGKCEWYNHYYIIDFNLSINCLITS